MARAPGVDNAVYNSDKWRDPHHFLSMLGPLAIPRAEYVHRTIAAQLGREPASVSVLDVGCGAGFVAEALARHGYVVTGVDPSDGSIAAARAHAREEGLSIDYRTGTGEALPIDASTFDVVCCLDVLEHVDDVGRVVGEFERVLKPGGALVFDTINRTWRSWLLAIKIMQDWPATSVIPPNVHRWKRFITPIELNAILRAHDLEPQEFAGLALVGHPLVHLQVLRRRRRGLVSYREVGCYLADHLALGNNMSVWYAGAAVKRLRPSR